MKAPKQPGQEKLEAYEALGKIFLRLGTQLLVAVGLLGVGILQVIRLFRDGLQKTSIDSFFMVSVLAVAALAAGIFKYLEGATRTRSTSFSFSRGEYEKVQLDIAKYQKVVTELTAIDKAALVKQLNEEIRKTASSEFLEEIKHGIANREKLDFWRKFMIDAAERLDSEIAAQGRRGTINMILGVATAISGIALLSYIVLAETHSITGIDQFLTECPSSW